MAGSARVRKTNRGDWSTDRPVCRGVDFAPDLGDKSPCDGRPVRRFHASLLHSLGVRNRDHLFGGECAAVKGEPGDATDGDAVPSHPSRSKLRLQANDWTDAATRHPHRLTLRGRPRSRSVLRRLSATPIRGLRPPLGIASSRHTAAMRSGRAEPTNLRVDRSDRVLWPRHGELPLAVGFGGWAQSKRRTWSWAATTRTGRANESGDAA